MNLSFQHLMAATAFVAASTASAAPQHDWTVTSGSATVTFAANARGALLAGGTSLLNQPTIPNVAGLSNPGSPNGAVVVRNTGVVNLALTSGSANDTGVLSLNSDKALLQFRRAWQDDDGALIQYSVFATNWTFDLPTATIYANLYSQDNGAAAVQSLGRVTLFKASIGADAHVVQDTIDAQGNIGAHATGTFTGALRIDPFTVDLLLSGLQLPTDPNGAISRILKDPFLDWGTVSYSAQLAGTPAVPEPSSYALIGAGLVAWCFTKRKAV